jgi:hypothetical protein
MEMKEFKFFKQNNLPQFISPGITTEQNNITENTYYFNVVGGRIIQIHKPNPFITVRNNNGIYVWEPVKIKFIATIPEDIMTDIAYSIHNNIIEILIFENNQTVIETWQLHGCTITELHIHQTSEITLDPQNIVLI